MYITKVVLKNIRCFDEFTLEFERTQRCVLIVGDNGEGKSTVLRSLAMGLCDESSAAALFRESPGKFVKQGHEPEGGSVEVYLSSPSGPPFIIETRFKSLGAFERLRQTLYKGDKKRKSNEIKEEKFPWKSIFVTGYGAGVRTLGSGSLDSYLAVDAVYSLFRYDEPLQNPGIALRRLVDEVEKKKRKRSEHSEEPANALRAFLELLRKVLDLRKKDRVYLTKKGIEVRGPWGRTQLESLGDGYRSMLTCVLDLMGRRLLYGSTIDHQRMRGIVLLDEVEQHLHPRWQLNVMGLLTEAFPKMQLIATTHSPLVVSGSKNCKIRKVSSSHDEAAGAFGWRPEDVYRDIMDLDRSRAEEIQEAIDRFRVLELRSLTGDASSEERGEMTRLRGRLERTLHGSDPTVLSLRLKNIRQCFDKTRKKN